MRCEVIAVGTELLLGQIVDTNSAWIAEQLALAGVDAHHQSTVGDNAARMSEVLRIALERSDAVIMCGGLGPTPDDITREVLAGVMGVPLVRDERVAERIRAMFSSRGRPMPENNLRQADIPAGASIMEQMPGTAAGLVCPIGDRVVYAVPGVPHEMREMVLGTVVSDLRRRAGRAAVIRSRVLRTWGQSESGLAELLAGRIAELDAAGNPTLAFLASGIEGLKVRITARADTEEQADAILDGEVAHLRPILGELIFSEHDRPMEHEVIDLLRERGLTLATAESVTGGLVSARLTDVPGASEVFRGGLVAYESHLKVELLDVPDGPVISEEAAQVMAQGARRLLGADAAVATTGVAGPSSQEGHPPGHVCLAWCLHDEVGSVTVGLPGDRARVRQFATISVLDLLRRRLVSG